MPIMHPRELWVSSGRWDRYVADGIMFVLKDRKGAEMCLGPTHEEIITSYVDSVINSYKQLPVNLYQIQDKFRDEIRPRFGVMRGREFIMLDAYSFDADDEGLDTAYKKMDEAYRRTFERCGLEFTVVEADPGAIGGGGSQEFMVVAETGEDAILYCDQCGYAANVEKADSRLEPPPTQENPVQMGRHATPDVRTVEQLEEFFGVRPIDMGKTLLYQAIHSDREEVVAVMCRGDLDVNEVKLTNVLGALAVKLADDEVVKSTTGAEVGFAGPVNLPEKIRLLADRSLEGRSNLLTGCNETGYHCLGVRLGRDSRMPEFHDLRLATAGEGCPKCPGILKQVRGIEVGHIFKLGRKYSAAMGATFTASNGKPEPFVMGCYGIGVSRTPAAAVEQHHDEKGIVWPPALAPFEVVVAILDGKREAQTRLGEQIYEQLKAAGIDACLDDRAVRPGAKFKDLELLGFPVQVVVGRQADEGIVELVVRRDGSKEELPADSVVARCQSVLASLGSS